MTAPKQPALVSASTQTDEVHIIPLGSTADPELLDSDDEPDSPSEDPEYSPDDETR